MKGLKLVAFLSVSLSCFSAFAGDQVSHRLLAKYDVDGDSAISLAEVTHKRKHVFRIMDMDNNGEVSFEEYQRLDADKRTAALSARFAMLDANADGRLDGEEYTSYLGSFKRLDQNRDGNLSPVEMATPKPDKVKPRADRCFLWICVRKNIRKKAK